MWLCGTGQTILLPGASPWLMMVLSSATTGLLFCRASRTSSDISSCTLGTCAADARQDAQCQVVGLPTQVPMIHTPAAVSQTAWLHHLGPAGGALGSSACLHSAVVAEGGCAAAAAAAVAGQTLSDALVLW